MDSSEPSPSKPGSPDTPASPGSPDLDLDVGTGDRLGEVSEPPSPATPGSPGTPAYPRDADGDPDDALARALEDDDDAEKNEASAAAVEEEEREEKEKEKEPTVAIRAETPERVDDAAGQQQASVKFASTPPEAKGRSNEFMAAESAAAGQASERSPSERSPSGNRSASAARTDRTTSAMTASAVAAIGAAERAEADATAARAQAATTSVLQEDARKARLAVARCDQGVRTQRRRVDHILAAHRLALDLATKPGSEARRFQQQLLELSDELLVPAGAELQRLREALARELKDAEFAAAKLRAVRLGGPAVAVADALGKTLAREVTRQMTQARFEGAARALASAAAGKQVKGQTKSVAAALALQLHKVSEANGLLREAGLALEASSKADAAADASGGAVDALVEAACGNGGGKAPREERARARLQLPEAVALLSAASGAAEAAWVRRSQSGWPAAEALLRVAEGPAQSVSRSLARSSGAMMRPKEEEAAAPGPGSPLRRASSDLNGDRSAAAARAAETTMLDLITDVGAAAAEAAAAALACLQQGSELQEARARQLRARLALAAEALNGAAKEERVAAGEEVDLEADAHDGDEEDALAGLEGPEGADLDVAEAGRVADMAAKGCEVQCARLEAWAKATAGAIADGAADFDRKALRVAVAQRRFEALVAQGLANQAASKRAAEEAAAARLLSPPPEGKRMLKTRQLSITSRVKQAIAEEFEKTV